MTGAKMLVKFDRNMLRLEGQQKAFRDEQLAWRKEIRDEHAAFRKEMRELGASQRETDRLLQGLIRPCAAARP
jgi:hypothetical protein